MKGRKRIVAICTILIMLINMFSPYTLLMNTVEAATGTIEEKPVIFNNLGVTTKGSNKVLTVEVAIVSEEIINGLDLQFSVDTSKLTPCNKNTGAESSVITLNSTQSEYCLSTFQKKTYTASTGTYRLTLTEPQGGTDIVNGLGYVPGSLGDDAIDVNGEGFPAYYPLIKLFFKVSDADLDTSNLVLEDLFTLVPVTGSLPTGMKISYKNASGTNVSRDITQIGGKGFAVPAKTVTSIAVKNNPNITTYDHGDNIDLTGGMITVTYSDGSTEDISMTDSKVSITSGSPADVNNQNVNISYGGQSTSFAIMVNDPVDALNITSPMTTTEYTHGDSLNFSGLQLEAIKRSGATVSLTQTSSGLSTSETVASVNSSEFTQISSGSDGTVRGTQKIKFTYEGKEATQTIIVNDTVSTISLKTQPSKTIYKRGETLNLSGATVEVTLGSGNKTNINLPDGTVTVSNYSPTLVGSKQNLQVSIGTIVATDTIDVEVYNYITSIQLTPPTKDLYDYNQELSLTGGRIRATWQSGTTSQVQLTDTTVTVTGYNKTTTGEQTVTVTYNPVYTLTDGTTITDTFTDTFAVEVQDTIDTITVTAPSKTTYKHGESLDLTGGNITVTTVTGTTKTVPMTTSMITESDGTSVNMSPTSSDFGAGTTINKTLKITYTEDGKTGTVNYPIEIVNDVRTVTMHTTPKTSYNVNDSLDLTTDGTNYGEILVTRAVGTPEVIALNEVGVQVTGFDSTTEHTTLPITVTYTENGISKTTSYNVIVKDTVKSVTLVNTPKTEYKYNEELDVTGGTIKIEKGSGDTTIPLDASMVTGYDKTALGEQVLTITYGGQTTTYKVKVKDYVTGITVNPNTVTGTYNDTLTSIIADNNIQYTVNYAKAGAQAATALLESMVSGYSATSITAQNLNVTYIDNDTNSATNTQSFTTTLKVTLADRVDTITVTAPSKVTYKHGESLDLTGENITVTTISGANKTVPMTTSMITESDGSSVNMSPGYSEFGSGNTLNKTLKITYTEDGKTETVNYPIEIINDVRTVAMHTTPKTSYNVNDNLDLTTDGTNYGEILVTRAVGTPEVIALNELGVQITGFDSTTEHTTLPITVTYTENGISQTTSYNITVTDTVKSITLVNTPKTDYKYNEELDVTGGTIKVEKGSGDTTIPLDTSMVTGYDKTALGEQVLTISYGGKTTTYKVNVKDYVTGITVNPNIVTGAYNDTLTSIIADNNIQYTVNYAKAGAQAATALLESMVSGYSSTSIATQNLNVAYTDNDTNSATNTQSFTTTLTVTLADSVDTITVTAPSKDTYKHGESLDITGGTITVTTTSGGSKTVPMTTTMITELDGSSVDMRPRAADFGTDTTINKTLKITYTEDGKTGTVNYPIEIINDVRSIAMYTTPKTSYNVNDSLDLTTDGTNYGEILVTRAVGTPEVIALNEVGVQVTGFDSTIEHTTLPITVTYTENGISQTTGYNITVTDTVKSVTLVNTPKTDYKYNEELDATGGTIKIEKGSGYTTIPLDTSMITGYDKTTLGEQVLTISYGGKTTTYKVKVKDYITKVVVNPNTITGIVNTELSDLLNDNNVKYEVTYAKAGTSSYPLTDTLITGYDKTLETHQTLTFTYTDADTESATLGQSFSDSLNITLSDPVTGISIKSNPDKTEYGYNDTIDLTGGIITVTTASGNTTDIPFTANGVSITEMDGSTVDLQNVTFGPDNKATKTIKVTYEGKTDTFTVTVINKLDSIAIKNTPKTNYGLGESIDLSIGSVEITRENGDTEIINLSDSRLTVTGFDSTVEHTQLPIKVEYTENGTTKDVSYDISVLDPVQAISIDTMPKTNYKYGDTLDVSTGVLKVTKVTGDVLVPITPNMVKETNGSEFDSKILGTRDLIIHYGDKTLNYEITVSDYVKNIIFTPPTKNKYEYGESLDLTGGKIETIMASGAPSSIIQLSDPSVTLSTFDPTDVGAQTINVTYGTFTDSFAVIVEDNIQSIQLTQVPTKTTYKYGDNLDVTGGIITVIRSSGPAETLNVTPSMVTGFNPNTLGNQVLTVTHSGKTATYSVEVEDWIKDINITKPNKLIYKIGENLDLTGGQVEAVMASGAITAPVPMTNSMITPPSTATVGAKTVQVTYEGITKTFGITVQDPLSAMTIKTLPNKTDYKYGENLDLTGATIEVTTESGAKEIIPITPSMVTGYNSKQLGNQTLTVTYEGLTDNFIVNVKDYISGLRVTPPTKTQYEYGEELDLTGGKVAIVMASGKIEETADMTASMISTFNPKQEGTQAIQVTYKGLTGSFNLSVIDKIKGISLNSEPNKTEYEYGENLDTTGASIKVIKSSGIYTVPVTNNMVTGYNSKSPGSQVLTINYGGYTAKFVVNVKGITINIDDEENQYRPYRPYRPVINDNPGTTEETKEPEFEVLPEQPKEEEPTIIPQNTEKPTAVLGEKDDKQESLEQQKLAAGILGLAGILLLIILLVSRRNVKIYVEEDGEWVLTGIDKIKKKNPKLDIDKYLDGDTYQSKVKIILNDTISEKLDEKEIEIKHRKEIINHKVEYDDEPYEIILE